MDADTLITIGDFCETLLTDPSFQFIAAYYEQQLVSDILATQPNEQKTREFAYSKVTAHREFISLMTDFIKKRDEARAPQPDQSDDDPTVHDIYGISD